MPNHVSNDLRINGNMEEINRFFEFARQNPDLTESKEEAVLREKLCLEENPFGHIEVNNFIPYPKEFAVADKLAEKARKEGKGYVKDGYNSGGYEWCIQNWGTKWGLYDFSDVKKFKSSAVISFSTAWSPPLPVILKMSEMFPKLTFSLKYYEAGAGFQGHYKCKAGEVLLNETGDYNGPRGG